MKNIGTNSVQFQCKMKDISDVARFMDLAKTLNNRVIVTDGFKKTEATNLYDMLKLNRDTTWTIEADNMNDVMILKNYVKGE